MTDGRHPARTLFWKDRDGSKHRCPKCGRPRDAVDAIEVHHLDENKHRHSPSNLIGLCRDCHQTGEHGRRRRVPARLRPRTTTSTEPPSVTGAKPRP